MLQVKNQRGGLPPKTILPIGDDHMIIVRALGDDQRKYLLPNLWPPFILKIAQMHFFHHPSHSPKLARFASSCSSKPHLPIFLGNPNIYEAIALDAHMTNEMTRLPQEPSTTC